MPLSHSDIQAAAKAIQDAERILVVPHANVDPDGIASALSCFELFNALGKTVTVICPDTLPEFLDFLPGYKNLQQDIDAGQNFIVTIHLDKGVEVDKLRYTVEDNQVNIMIIPKSGKIRPQQISLGDGDTAYDLILIVDSADLALLGDFYIENIDLFSSVPILNIDHHVSNTGYGQWKLVDATAASATEVLYSFFMQVPMFREKISVDMATLLLTGIITDTRSFQNPNTTPRTLEVAAELLEKGARQQEIIQHIYKTKPLSTLRIWGRALNGIQIDRDARIVWSSVSKEDLSEMGASPRETHGILDELISTIPDADVHVLFTELPQGGLKASMRSSSAVDASELAGTLFGGGGHPRAAGFRIAQFENFQLQVLECVKKLAQGMKDQGQENSDLKPEKSLKPKLKAHTQSKPKKVSPPLRSSKKQKGVDIAKELSNGKGENGSTDIMGELSKK